VFPSLIFFFFQLPSNCQEVPFLNHYDRPVYMTHVSQMPMEGERFGFYVEPGIMMRCDNIVVKRLISDKNFSGSPWMPLDDNEMPLGSVILRG
jgi:hypothetical protein